MRSFTAPAGLPVGLTRHRPAVGDGVQVEERRARRLGELASVSATSISPASRRLQYWMLNGVALSHDVARIDPRLRFELTYMADRPIGWERPKSAGHVHGRLAAGTLGFAEVCEVLEGIAGFLIQDLLPGPSASFAALITVAPGERIILPPFLHHLTVNVAGDLVYANGGAWWRFSVAPIPAAFSMRLGMMMAPLRAVGLRLAMGAFVFTA